MPKMFSLHLHLTWIPQTQQVHSYGVMGKCRTYLIKPKSPAESLSPSPKWRVLSEDRHPSLGPHQIRSGCTPDKRKAKTTLSKHMSGGSGIWPLTAAKMFLLCPHVHLKGNDRLNWIRENASCSFFGNLWDSCQRYLSNVVANFNMGTPRHTGRHL